MSNNKHQSIASCADDTKSKHDFFRGSEKDQDDFDSVLSIGNNAHKAASITCHEIAETFSFQLEFFPHWPLDAAIEMLEVTKQVCLDGAVVLGSDIQYKSFSSFFS